VRSGPISPGRLLLRQLSETLSSLRRSPPPASPRKMEPMSIDSPDGAADAEGTPGRGTDSNQLLRGLTMPGGFFRGWRYRGKQRSREGTEEQGPQKMLRMLRGSKGAIAPDTPKRT